MPGQQPRHIGDTASVNADEQAPVSVAFCPCPPLLLPEVAGAAAEDVAALRIACGAAVEAVLLAGPDVVVVVGPGVPAGVRYGAGDGGDLRGFGVDVEVGFCGPVAPGGARVPLAHTIGARLLDASGHTGTRIGVGPDDLAEVLGSQPGRVGVLAMGDGTAKRTLKAPGHLDPAAEPYDDAVAAALAAGDAAALAGLDAAEGERLMAAGVPVWRAVGAALAGREVAGKLLLHEAPFGVAYLVASWTA
jgi:hypothetical protein